MVLMAMNILAAIGVEGLSLCLNSLGCAVCRPGYRETLRTHLEKVGDSLCADCRRRSESNPLRVFDCKVEGCRLAMADAPSISAHLCHACMDHFDLVRGYLDSCGVSYVLNPGLVRGLDYYCKTTFEIQTDRLGAQNAVAGGGRYDGLVKLLGGPDQPAIGFAVGIERVAALLEQGNQASARGPDLFFATLGEASKKRIFPLLADLRNKGFWVEMEYGDRGLKAQLKRADKLGARRVIIVGDEELKRGEGILKDMGAKSQEPIPLEDIAGVFERKK
jgi:histidyl-tRNA synthetase